MKIAVNGRALIKKYTGIGIVTRHLLKEMANAYEDVEFLLFVSDKMKDDYSEYFPKNVQIIKINEWKFLGERFSKLFFEQISFPLAARNCDVLFCPYPCNPFYKLKKLTCVIAHDAIVWKVSEYFNTFFSRIYNGFAKRNLKKSDIVFTVSKYSKKDLMKYCGLEEEKIKVIHNDAGDDFKIKVDDNLASKTLKNIGVLARKYFIYSGGYDERKNVKKLVKVFSEFSKKHKDIKLVLVGEKIFDNKLYSSFEDAKMVSNIVFSGSISDLELNALYSNAIALIHLSREEGFNLPIVEASNCDCPLILSDIEINREIAGNEAVFVDLEDDMRIIEAMENILDEELRVEAIEGARKIAGKYLWERSALRYMDIILTKLKK
jgi:glycosyltransferase involved in cell wall biosynthesis